IALSVALPTAFVTAHTEEEPYTDTLWAGQNINVGNVSVWNNGENLYIKYLTMGDWYMNETQLYVGLEWPETLAPGQFPYKHEDIFTQMDEYVIPLNEIDATIGNTVYVFAHATVVQVDPVTSEPDWNTTETAWAGDVVPPSPPEKWYAYFTYVIQGEEEEVPPPTEMGARTIGYWKNHLDAWPEDFKFMDVNDIEILLTYFPGEGAEEDGMAQWEKVRVQLLAVELNIACFGLGTDYNFDYESTGIYDVISDAYDFLGEYMETTLRPGDKGWDEYMELGSEIYEALDDFNNMGDEVFEVD
ncbi:MAG: hypothetical protein ACP5ER_05640, partial [Candidatus Bathyarchaeales archaeon]